MVFYYVGVIFESPTNQVNVSENIEITRLINQAINNQKILNAIIYILISLAICNI